MRLLLTLSAVATLLVAMPAAAVQIFDFDGQAHDAAFVGDTLSMVSVINNGSALPTPLPLDFVNYQYTVVVSGLRLDSTGTVDMFSGGAIAIYEDATTAADFGDETTFGDGVAILSGDLAAFTRQMFTATLGAGAGSVNWTGGARIGDLHPADRGGWTFLVNVSRAASQVRPGFDERWDGKVEPQEEVVATESSSMGGLKSSW